MNHRTKVVLLILFFTGLIVLWWADYAGVPTAEQRRQMAGRVLPALMDTPVADIRRVEIVREGERIVFDRKDGGRWQMTEPVDAAADPSRVEELVRNLKDLGMAPDAGTIAGRPAEYGLGKEAATVRVFGADLRTPLAALRVGDDGGRTAVRPAGRRVGDRGGRCAPARRARSSPRATGVTGPCSASRRSRSPPCP